MAEFSYAEWLGYLDKVSDKPMVVHDTKDGSPDNEKQPEAESQVKHVIEILFFKNLNLTNCFFQID